MVKAYQQAVLPSGRKEAAVPEIAAFSSRVSGWMSSMEGQWWRLHWLGGPADGRGTEGSACRTGEVHSELPKVGKRSSAARGSTRPAQHT